MHPQCRGYAAVKAAGLQHEDPLSEAGLAEAARLRLEDLSRETRRSGVPRDHLFTHGAGWKDGEPLPSFAEMAEGSRKLDVRRT